MVKIFFNCFDFAALETKSLIFSTDVFFLEVNVKSISETFGVGTRIAVPSNLPFNLGKTKLNAYAAPVEVGIIEIAAPLALLRSLWV